MTNEAAYFLVAIGFILVLNLMAFISLRINYRSSRKTYLLLACIAVALEALRQAPALALSLDPESFPAVLLTFMLQFAASWMLLLAIIRKESQLNRNHKILLGSLLAVYFAGLAFSILNGFPQSTAHWLAITLPAIFTATVILAKVIHTKITAVSGRALIILSAISLVAIRIAQLMVEATEMVYLLYYLDVVNFPILVSAIVLAEIEFTHSTLGELLKERTRSETNLRFILDNTVDVILTVNNAGLLMNWNKRAENVFGYTNSQTIGKLHIDELFPGNYWHKNIEQETTFEASMEHIDGKIFPVNVRMKTVTEEGENYSIYDIKERNPEM